MRPPRHITGTDRRLVLRLCVAHSFVSVLFATSCAVSNMNFVQDQRVRIIAPTDRSHVTLPVRLQWEVRAFRITGRNGSIAADSGYFAVFVDHPPIPPGKTLEWYALQDGSCGGQPCGTVDKLAHIYTTKNNALELVSLPATTRRTTDIEQHEAVIILLNGAGERIGESAFYVRFTYERKA